MKKHISLAAALIMLFTTIFSNSVFAAFSDVTAENNKYFEAITTLSKLNVINGYEDGTFKPDATITRAEFTKMVVYTLGLQDIQVEPKEFSDIDSHWARYNIKTAYDNGIINGMGDGTFAPDANVTYEQALKMVVCTLGYKTHAEMNGGYPEGYRAQAASLKLTDKVSGMAYDAPATRGVIAQVLYNALEVDMMTTDVAGNVVDAEKTLLNDYLKVKKLKGIMVGVEEYVTGDCTEKLNLKEMDVLGSRDEGEVIINYGNYTTNVTEINKYLGKTITVYYRQPRENDTRELIIIDDESTNNVEYEISFDNIRAFDGNQLEYYTDDAQTKTKKVKFSDDEINIRYNGRVVSHGDTVSLEKKYIDENGVISTMNKDASFEEALEEWLNPKSDYFIYGDVKLTDRESDGFINDVQINDYETIVAFKTPTTSDYRITDKLMAGNYITLNPNSAEYNFTIVKNGNQIPVTSVTAGDILLYAKSLDGELYSCVIETKTVTGNITAMENDYDSITIDGTEYTIGSMCRNYISTNQDGKTLSIGQSGTFYIDKYNTVVYGTIAEEKTKPYAYITNAYTSDNGNDYYISAFIPSKATSGSVNYKLKSKVSVNGKKMSAGETMSYLSDMATENIAENNYYSNNDINNATMKNQIYGSKSTKLSNGAQVARIELNSDNEVTDIITVTDDETAYNEDGTTAVTTNEDTSKIVRCKDLTQYNYTSSSFTLNNRSQFSINSSTTIIYVPGDRTDKAEYSKKSTSSFTSTEKYYVEAYDISATKVAGLVVLYGKTGSSTAVTKVTDYSIVADRLQETYDEANDELRNSMSVYAGTSSTPRKWTTATQSEFADVTIGDVIMFGYDQDRYAQDRINIMKFDDIAEIVDGKKVTVEDEDGEAHEELYNWTEAPDDEESVQTEKFNYRYPKTNTNANPWYETYTSATLGTIPYSQACMYNVYQIQEENNKLLLTQGGFKVNDSGDPENVLYDTDDYVEITIASSTKIIRMEEDREGFSPYVEDTETTLTYRDLKAAQNYGADCSKILVCSLRGTARLIVIYD